jgi:CheY-like chemotaxis protein
MKVMVVDDNQEMRRMICSIIGDAAVTCEFANGAEASDAYPAELPDLVLMDLMMPQVGGIAATKIIRAAYPQAKIAIVTSHNGAALREAATQAGAFAYVLKENLMDLRPLLTTEALAS